MKQVHVIPVPDGMTADQAFAEIEVFGKLAEGRQVSDQGDGGSWALIEVDDEP